MGLLDGGASALFGELMGTYYLAATLYSDTPTYADDGSMTTGETSTTCLARVDSATERMRQADGFTQTDRAILVLASSIADDITTDHRIEILEGPYAGSVFSIASADRPPAGSYWLCRGSR